MVSYLTLTLAMLLMINFESVAVSRIIRSTPIERGDLAVEMEFDFEWAEYVPVGSPVTEEGTPYIAFYDTADGSIFVTYRDVSKRGEKYYHIIPGDQIAVRVSTRIEWDDEKHMFTYIYTLISDTSSIVSIQVFGFKDVGCRKVEYKKYLELFIEPEDHGDWVLSPHAVYGCAWYADDDTSLIQPGDTLSDLVLRSNGPPSFTEFYVEGQRKILEKKGIDYPLGQNIPDWDWSIRSAIDAIEAVHRGVRGLAFTPGSLREGREPGDLVSDLDTLYSHGYIEKRATVDSLKDIFSVADEQSRGIHRFPTEEEVRIIERVLDEIQTFKSRMESEAWSYIAENLKYVRRYELTALEMSKNEKATKERLMHLYK